MHARARGQKEKASQSGLFESVRVRFLYFFVFFFFSFFNQQLQTKEQKEKGRPSVVVFGE